MDRPPPHGEPPAVSGELKYLVNRQKRSKSPAFVCGSSSRISVAQIDAGDIDATPVGDTEKLILDPSTGSLVSISTWSPRMIETACAVTAQQVQISNPCPIKWKGPSTTLIPASPVTFPSWLRSAPASSSCRSTSSTTIPVDTARSSIGSAEPLTNLRSTSASIDRLVESHRLAMFLTVLLTLSFTRFPPVGLASCKGRQPDRAERPAVQIPRTGSPSPPFPGCTPYQGAGSRGGRRPTIEQVRRGQPPREAVTWSMFVTQRYARVAEGPFGRE